MTRLSIVVLVSLSVLSCKARKEQAEQGSAVLGDVPIDENRPSPVRTMYHYGEYVYLRQNGRQDYFTQPSWDTITKNYEMSRKGLYVAAHPAYNERYVNHLFETSADMAPWLMEVVIKDECMVSPRIAAKVWQLDTDPYFRRWNPNQARSFAQNCRSEYQVDKSNYDAFARRLGSPTCEAILSSYFDQQNIGLVHDMYWPHENFWIIRDPACIEEMRAEPEEVLKMMAVREMWNMAPFSNDWNRHQAEDASMAKFKTRLPGAHAFYILLRALHESSSWNASDLDDIRAEGGRSDIVWRVKEGSVRLSQILDAVLAKAQTCASSGNLSSMKAQLKLFLDKAHTRQAADFTAAQHAYYFYYYGLPKVSC